MRRGFTLIELLIVLGILAVVTVAVFLTLNPVEFLRQARDTRRVAELKSLSAGIGAYRASASGASLGATSTVYVSLPDDDPVCGSYVLPALPPGWVYACATEENYRKLDGTGWIPLDVASLAKYVSVSALPVDPANDEDGRYYAYVADGNAWELSAFIESEKFRNGGRFDIPSKDGGDNPDRYEAGRALDLQP